jgi:hypothetical protein
VLGVDARELQCLWRAVENCGRRARIDCHCPLCSSDSFNTPNTDRVDLLIGHVANYGDGTRSSRTKHVIDT